MWLVETDVLLFTTMLPEKKNALLKTPNKCNVRNQPTLTNKNEIQNRSLKAIWLEFSAHSNLQRRRCTFCRASSSSLRLFSSCLAAAAPPPPPICSSSRRLVDTLAFSYSSCRWACSSRAFLKAPSASCWRCTRVWGSYTDKHEIPHMLHLQYVQR